MSGTYLIEVECSNCGCDGTVEIKKGTPVGFNIECPNCGCMTASKKKLSREPYIPYPKRNPWHDQIPHRNPKDIWFNENPIYKRGPSDNWPDRTVEMKQELCSV